MGVRGDDARDGAANDATGAPLGRDVHHEDAVGVGGWPGVDAMVPDDARGGGGIHGGSPFPPDMGPRDPNVKNFLEKIDHFTPWIGGIVEFHEPPRWIGGFHMRLVWN